MIAFRLSRIILLSLLFIPFAARAEAPKKLAFSSPNGRWSVAAHWVDSNAGGYIWELRDNKTGKTYFQKTKVAAGESLPRCLDAAWSANGHDVALNLYYGRIAYEVDVICVEGKTPVGIPLFPRNVTAYDDFQTSGKWLNDTYLAVVAWLPVNWSRDNTARTYNLMIRFSGTKSTIIKKN